MTRKPIGSFICSVCMFISFNRIFHFNAALYKATIRLKATEIHNLAHSYTTTIMAIAIIHIMQSSPVLIRVVLAPINFENVNTNNTKIINKEN